MAHIVSGWHVVTYVVDWAASNPMVSTFTGIFIYECAYKVIKMTPTTKDDLLFDVITKAFKKAFGKAIKKKSVK